MSADNAPRMIDLAREPPLTLAGHEARPSTRELIVGGRPLVLEPRVMQVLIALTQRRGEVVSRDDLIASCWGGRAVGEDAINRCIQAIRRLAEAHGGFAITTIARVGYRLDEAPLAAREATAPLLAVLAFDNLSGDPDMVWFSDGVSEEILHTVARNSTLKVIGRGSSFQFRGVDKAARKIADELCATHVLDGSVRRSGAKLRISAHLIECTGETTLWSDRFDRDLSDVFALQDEIAADVSAALKVVFAPGVRSEAIDPAAYDLYLKGIHASASDADGRLTSIVLLEQATTLAPRFARAWASLAAARARRLRVDETRRPYMTLRAEVVDAAETALKLDPTLGIAYQALARLEPFARYADREALQDKALNDDPSDPQVLSEAAQFFAHVGRIREAVGLARQSHDLDPLSFTTARRYAAMLAAAGEYEHCIDRLDRFREIWPDDMTLVGNAIAAMAFRGDWSRFDELTASALVKGSGGNIAQLAADFEGLFRRRDPIALKRLLAEAHSDLSRTGRVSFDQLVNTYRAGLTDETFSLIDQASFDYMFDAEQRWPTGFSGMSVIFSATFNNGMMRDPRFVRLCAKLGLCDYWVATGRWPDCAETGLLPYDFGGECRRLIGAGL